MEAYLQLFLRSISTDKAVPGKCVAVAFTASRPKEGVSYVVESFASEIARRTRRRVLVASSDDLQKVDIRHYSRVASHCSGTNLPNLFVLSSKMKLDEGVSTQIQIRSKHAKFERGIDNLETLRFCFDFILLDCSALSESGDAAMLAPSVEGVVMVVEADRTRKEQVRNSIKAVQAAEGNFLGCVMNKRRYTVPGWIYDRL
jgi:protein-tyrosine kinase